MEYKVTGKLKVVSETHTFESGFSKREFVVTTEDQYPQDIKLEFTKDKCAILDKYELAQSVTVSFNLRGNEYNGKYYVNLQAWRIEAAGAPFQAEPMTPTMDEPIDEGSLPF